MSLGLLVGLDGELGSGKTRFVQGFAEGLGIDPGEVSSPTFVLCHIYPGRETLYHADAYRLNSIDEVADLGLSEAMAGGAIVVVEWADRIAAALPADRISIRLLEVSPAERRIQMTAGGPLSAEVLRRFAVH
jgi:tRNA threonylcarbamoyladenosine biosynthesis protein TsaE